MKDVLRLTFMLAVFMIISMPCALGQEENQEKKTQQETLDYLSQKKITIDPADNVIIGSDGSVTLAGTASGKITLSSVQQTEIKTSTDFTGTIAGGDSRGTIILGDNSKIKLSSGTTLEIKDGKIVSIKPAAQVTDLKVGNQLFSGEAVEYSIPSEGTEGYIKSSKAVKAGNREFSVPNGGRMDIFIDSKGTISILGTDIDIKEDGMIKGRLNGHALFRSNGDMTLSDMSSSQLFNMEYSAETEEYTTQFSNKIRKSIQEPIKDVFGKNEINDYISGSYVEYDNGNQAVEYIWRIGTAEEPITLTKNTESCQTSKTSCIARNEGNMVVNANSNKLAIKLMREDEIKNINIQKIGGEGRAVINDNGKSTLLFTEDNFFWSRPSQFSPEFSFASNDGHTYRKQLRYNEEKGIYEAVMQRCSYCTDCASVSDIEKELAKEAKKFEFSDKVGKTAEQMANDPKYIALDGAVGSKVYPARYNDYFKDLFDSPYLSEEYKQNLRKRIDAHCGAGRTLESCQSFNMPIEEYLEKETEIAKGKIEQYNKDVGAEADVSKILGTKIEIAKLQKKIDQYEVAEQGVTCIGMLQCSLKSVDGNDWTQGRYASDPTRISEDLERLHGMKTKFMVVAPEIKPTDNPEIVVTKDSRGVITHQAVVLKGGNLNERVYMDKKIWDLYKKGEIEIEFYDTLEERKKELMKVPAGSAVQNYNDRMGQPEHYVVAIGEGRTAEADIIKEKLEIQDNGLLRFKDGLLVTSPNDKGNFDIKIILDKLTKEKSAAKKIEEETKTTG